MVNNTGIFHDVRSDECARAYDGGNARVELGGDDGGVVLGLEERLRTSRLQLGNLRSLLFVRLNMKCFMRPQCVI